MLIPPHRPSFGCRTADLAWVARQRLVEGMEAAEALEAGTAAVAAEAAGAAAAGAAAGVGAARHAIGDRGAEATAGARRTLRHPSGEGDAQGSADHGTGTYAMLK